MQDFRVKLTVEVERVGNGLAIQTPAPLDLVYAGDRWHAESGDPPVLTPELQTMESALVEGANQLAIDMQAAVIERPLPFPPMTPADIPEDMF